jgi:hypothetical protein
MKAQDTLRCVNKVFAHKLRWLRNGTSHSTDRLTMPP